MRPELFLTSPDTLSACADTALVAMTGWPHVKLLLEITQQWSHLYDLALQLCFTALRYSRSPWLWKTVLSVPSLMQRLFHYNFFLSTQTGSFSILAFGHKPSSCFRLTGQTEWKSPSVHMYMDSAIISPNAKHLCNPGQDLASTMVTLSPVQVHSNLVSYTFTSKCRCSAFRFNTPFFKPKFHLVELGWSSFSCLNLSNLLVHTKKLPMKSFLCEQICVCVWITQTIIK